MAQLQEELASINNLLDPVIDELQGDILKSVSESIQIESTEAVSTEEMPFGEGPAKALQHALKLGETLGFYTKNLNNVVGYVEFGDGDEIIAVLGHLDVVPAGEGWEHPPFGGEVHDGCLWGRGALDNKGPIIGALYSMKAIQQSGLPLKRRIRVIFGTNEETGSKDIPFYCEHEEAPVMGFTPDASYPVIFAEKGILTFSISKKLDQTDGKAKLIKIFGGTASNIVPDFAEASISCDGELSHHTATGLAAHGSIPEKGENAIINLIRNLEGSDFSQDLKQFFSFLSEKIGVETDGRSMGIQMQDEKSGALTLNLAMIRYQSEQEIKAIVNIRYPVTKKVDEIMKAVLNQAADAGIIISLLGHKAPLYVNEDSELIKKLQCVYEVCTGEKSGLIAIGGGTYAKAMKNIVAFGPVFPGQEDVTHQADEHISIENLMKNIKIMASAMYLLAN